MGADLLDWIMEHVFPWVVIVFLAGLLIGLPAVGYFWWQASKAPTFTLNKSEWACTQSQTIPVTTYVQAGKVMIPMTAYTKECHQWSRQ